MRTRLSGLVLSAALAALMLSESTRINLSERLLELGTPQGNRLAARLAGIERCDPLAPPDPDQLQYRLPWKLADKIRVQLSTGHSRPTPLDEFYVEELHHLPLCEAPRA